MLKHVILFEKQYFWVFVSWNIRKENKEVNKNYFLSCMSYLSLSKGSLSCPQYLLLQYLFVKHKIKFQTDDAVFQNCVCSNANFVKKTKHFSIFELLNIHNESKEILYITHHISMWKEVTFKTDRAYFSKLCQLKQVIFLRNNICELLRIKIFSSRRNHAMRTIFYLEQNIFFETLSNI